MQAASINVIDPVPENVQAKFLALLPRLQTHAAITFRHVGCPHARAEKIAESIALAWTWFVRLRARGRDVEQFPAAFATLAVRAVGCGRRCCGQERTKDVLSAAAQRRHGFALESLDSGPATACRLDTVFAAHLKGDPKTPVPDQVAFRIDWSAFFASLAPRDRALAEFLALGHSVTSAAGRFGISNGRVSQLRRHWGCGWRRFQGAL